jgi:hypothetical protein
MDIRRPVAALFLAIAVLGGGAGTLTGCSAAGGGVERNDGTTDEETENTSGNDPSDVSQGSVPDNSDNGPDDNQNSERDEESTDGGNN